MLRFSTCHFTVAPDQWPDTCHLEGILLFIVQWALSENLMLTSCQDHRMMSIEVGILKAQGLSSADSLLWRQFLQLVFEAETQGACLLSLISNNLFCSPLYLKLSCQPTVCKATQNTLMKCAGFHSWKFLIVSITTSLKCPPRVPHILLWKAL